MRKENKEAKIKKAYQFYKVANEILHLDQMHTMQEQVRAIVFHTNTILTEICMNADFIKIDLLDKVNEEVKVDKNIWREIVQLSYKVAYGKIDDKFIDKTNNKTKEEAYNVNLLKTFFDNYVYQGKREAIADKDVIDSYEIPSMPAYFNTSFNDCLTDAVETRRNLNKVLWPAFWSFYKAAYYITNGEMTRAEFKDLVDWEHYRKGGYPNENSKPKLWAIFDNFDRACRLMGKYEFPQLQELMKKFGLEVKLLEPSEDRNIWE